MKIYKILSVALLIMVMPLVALAQLTVPQGGTGQTSFTAGYIPYGGSSSLRLDREAAFFYTPSLNRLTVENSSTTILTADQICFNADNCRTTWPTSGGGGGSISTSSIPSIGQLAFWTSPSTLAGIATGTLTETATGLEFNATRGLVGGAAVLSLSSGYTIPLSASTTEWANSYATSTLLTPTYIRGLFSNTATGLTYTGATGVTALTSGYNIPLSASTTDWGTFYGTPSTRITAGTGLSWSGNTLNGSSRATSSWTVCSLSTCDYVTDGTADEVQINQAISRASSTGGVIQLFAQNYNLAAPIILSGLATEGDGNPEIQLIGMGREATKLVAASNVNAIEIRNRAKYDIRKLTFNIAGSGSGIKGFAGTERGNWQSNIEDIYIVGDFFSMASTSWGIDLQSPFRMRLANIEMNGVANGANLSSHTDSFNPGNISIDRMFVDLWDNAANASATALRIAVASPSSTGVNNLISVNRLDVAGGSNLTNSIGVHLLGSISSYGDSRHHTFTNMNIEDVKVAYKLQRARDNTFIDLNYTRVLNGGTIIDLDSNSHNNKFENLYAVAQGSGQTFNLINDSNGSSNLPNFLTRVDGWQPSSVSINATLAGNTILEHIDLSGGSPTIDTDITNRNNTRTFQDVLVTDEAYGAGWNGSLEVATKNALYDMIETLARWAGQVWEGVHDFSTAVLKIPNGASLVIDAIGEFGIDTTGDQLLVGDSSGNARVVQIEDVKIWSTTIASTSPRFISAGLYPVPTRLDGYTITRIQCHVTGGTSKVIAVEDASGNSSEDITCATTNTTDDGSITNPTYTASELSYIDFGATTGAVDYVSISVFGNWTRE